MATVKDQLVIALTRIDALTHDVSVLEGKLKVAQDRTKYESLAYRAKLAKAAPSAPSDRRAAMDAAKAAAIAGKCTVTV